MAVCDLQRQVSSSRVWWRYDCCLSSSLISLNSDCMESFGDDDGFFDMLTRSQGRRLDDQRCTFAPTRLSRSASTAAGKAALGMDNTEDLLNILQKLNNRLEEQRCAGPSVNPDDTATANDETSPDDENGSSENLPDEEFFDLLMSSQSSRIDEQRSQDPSMMPPLVPNEDFCNLIQHVQSSRIDDQRSPFPL